MDKLPVAEEYVCCRGLGSLVVVTCMDHVGNVVVLTVADRIVSLYEVGRC